MTKGYAAALCVLGFALPVYAGQVSGHVRVDGRGSRELTTTAVFAKPLDNPAPARPRVFSVTQRNKTFVPQVLAIPAGSIVDFPNGDLIFHNVFSLSRPRPFDLGLYRSGESKSRLFTQPAVYRVFCNIHPEMAAIILVLPTPFIVQADDSGNYRLDLPAGRYRLAAWSGRSQPVSTELKVFGDRMSAPDLRLDESQFVEIPHKNKFGHDYPVHGYDPLRGERTAR